MHKYKLLKKKSDVTALPSFFAGGAMFGNLGAMGSLMGAGMGGKKLGDPGMPTKGEAISAGVNQGLATGFSAMSNFGAIKNSGGTNLQKDMQSADAGVNAVADVAANFGPYGQAASAVLKIGNQLGGMLMGTPQTVKDFKVNDTVGSSSGFTGIASQANDLGSTTGTYADSGLAGKLFGKKKLLRGIDNSNKLQAAASTVMNAGAIAKDSGLASANMFATRNNMKLAGGPSFAPMGQQGMVIKPKAVPERTLWGTASQFIPGYETYLDGKSIVDGVREGDKAKFNSGIIGIPSMFSLKAVTNSLDYLTEKFGGKALADTFQQKREGVVNSSPAHLQKLFARYGAGGYDKWVAAGKPDLDTPLPNNTAVASRSKGGTMCASGSNGTKTASKYQKLIGVSKAIKGKKIVKKAQQGAQIAALVKKPIETTPPPAVAAAPTLTSAGGLPRDIAVKQYAPLNVNEQQAWNGFVGYVDKAGYKGNPDLDVRDKGLSKQLFDNYSTENNLQLNYDEFIPRLQTHIKSQRDNVIAEARKGKAQIPGMVEYFDRAKAVDIGDEELEKQFMSGLSKIDGWAGSKTTSYKFPSLTKPEWKGLHPGESVRDQDRYEANYNMVGKHEEGGSINVIVDGALHARKHELKDLQDFIDAEITLKGVPVVTKSEGGEIKQHAEVEVDELILRLEVTKKLEALMKEGTEKAEIEAGKLLAKEIVKNTKDSKSKILKTA